MAIGHLMRNTPRASSNLAYYAVVAGGLALVGLCVVWMGAGREVAETAPFQAAEARDTVGDRSLTSKYRSRNVDSPAGVRDFAAGSDRAVYLDPFGVRNWSSEDQLRSPDGVIDATSNTHPTAPESFRSTQHNVQAYGNPLRANEPACTWNRDDPCWE